MLPFSSINSIHIYLSLPCGSIQTGYSDTQPEDTTCTIYMVLGLTVLTRRNLNSTKTESHHQDWWQQVYILRQRGTERFQYWWGQGSPPPSTLYIKVLTMSIDHNTIERGEIHIPPRTTHIALRRIAPAFLYQLLLIGNGKRETDLA